VTYRIAFTKRFESGGHASPLNPTVALDSMLAEGIVGEKRFVERLEPESEHSQEVMDEDDAFLGSSAAEVWEYEVLDSRRDEFEDAVGRAGRILEFEIVDDTPLLPEDLSDTSAAQADEDQEEARATESNVLDPERQTERVSSRGSGVRAGDDGPGGQPTGPELETDTDEVDELTVEKARDTRLGLTNRGKKPPEDWAANTGPTRNPERGIATGRQSDYGSTLGPAKGKR